MLGSVHVLWLWLPAGGPCGVLAAVQAHLIATLMEQVRQGSKSRSTASNSSSSSITSMVCAGSLGYRLHSCRARSPLCNSPQLATASAAAAAAAIVQCAI
jgi:hypothetical protein